jgi:glycosyltransferase involved in cell wall biosynthesis
MRKHADVCLILEGTYPYVTGGVSNWAHELIQEQNHLSFHLVAIVPQDEELEMKYTLPGNVHGVTVVRLGKLEDGEKLSPVAERNLHHALREPLAKFMDSDPVHLDELKKMVNTLRGYHSRIGSEALLNSREAWEQCLALYEEHFDNHSMLDFFWSYRAIAGGIYSILLADLPSADIYHAMSTGYAGLMLARAKIETGKPTMITEHGIYTNERRIEVISADWLKETASQALTIDKQRRDLRDLWIDAINNFSKACYEASDHIITLFTGNQAYQLEDGANPAKMKIIPNGVDLARFGKINHKRSAHPTIAMIGRVVPVKDVKTYIRAVSLLKQYAPDIRAYIIGPTNENELYYEECVSLVKLLGLEENIMFTGQVRVDEYLDQIDLLVMTSISEAQPLVMLEAGACGIPLVATDVGACREIIEGTEGDTGRGGVVTALANPSATAQAIYKLLNDHELYDECARNIGERIRTHYNQDIQHGAYRNLYAQHLQR